MIWETVRLALQAIFRNALRSFLTVLGVVIGVGAVIAMVTIGDGATKQVETEISSLGANILFLRPGQGFGPGRVSASAPDFDMKDVAAIREQIGGLQAVSPSVSASATAVYGNANWSTSITGASNDFLVAREWPLVSGRSFYSSEESAGKAVCLIGATVRAELFGSSDPIGRRIRLKNVSCEVIGVLAEKGQSGFGQDQDDTVIMPAKAVMRRFVGNNDVPSILLSARDGADTAKIQRDVTYLMRERRRITLTEEDDFNVRDMAEVAETMTSATKVMTGLLGAVAAVSLLVGGIGIMNIMLVSVTERTREIGIRLAIGAQEGQVLLQFLVEAVVLSLFGGGLGVALGLGLAGLAAATMNVPFVPDASMVMLAFVFSAAVGVAFGYFPARRAARLDPIEALRRE